jgi:hypothetical protein
LSGKKLTRTSENIKRNSESWCDTWNHSNNLLWKWNLPEDHSNNGGNHHADKYARKVGEQSGEISIGYQGKVAVTKYHEKHKPAKFDKKLQLEKVRAEYLKKKQEQTDK